MKAVYAIVLALVAILASASTASAQLRGGNYAGSPKCCRARKLNCVACAAGMSPKDFCESYPKRWVCRRRPGKPIAPKPIADAPQQPDADAPKPSQPKPIVLDENTDFESIPTPRLRNVCRRMGIGFRGPREALLGRIAKAIKYRTAKGMDPYKNPRANKGHSGYKKVGKGGRSVPDMKAICQKTGNDMALRILCGKQSYAGKSFPKYYLG